MKPVPLDDNGRALLDRGSDLFTHRIEALGTDPAGLSLPLDFKEVMLHVELGAEALMVTGTAPGSTQARFTTQGCSWTVPIAGASGKVFALVAAAEGSVALSIFAWR